MCLNFNDYQSRILQSKDCPSNPVYSALGLNEEAGEVAGKIKKYWRDVVYMDAKKFNEGKSEDLQEVNTNETWMGAPRKIAMDDIRRDIIKEMGDVLWYLADLANDIGVSLEEVALCNIEKISKRLSTGTLHGAGDNREEQ